MNSYSQAGQDLLALSLLKHKPLPKTFLDLGCNDPLHNNNTYLLEQNGWQGLSVDLQDFQTQYALHRHTPFLKADLITLDWPAILNYYPSLLTLDYLSFDVDNATLKAFQNFPFNLIHFHVLTIEHDAYRVGPTTRKILRSTLSTLGYTLLCADVTLSGFGEFEDWWVDDRVVDPILVNKVRSSGKNCLDICAALC